MKYYIDIWIWCEPITTFLIIVLSESSEGQAMSILLSAITFIVDFWCRPITSFLIIVLSESSEGQAMSTSLLKKSNEECEYRVWIASLLDFRS